MGERARSGLAWLLALIGLWLIYISSTAPADIVLGAVSALGATGFVLVMREQAGRLAAPHVRWLARTWVLGPRLFSETVTVFGALYRKLILQERVVGAFRAVPYPGVYPNELTAAAADAFTVLANSLTPNSVVLDVDRLDGLVLLHQLVPAQKDDVRRQVLMPGPAGGVQRPGRREGDE